MGQEVVTLAGGCFWCVEAVFEAVGGGRASDSGSSNGQVRNPSDGHTHDAVQEPVARNGMNEADAALAGGGR